MAASPTRTTLKRERSGFSWDVDMRGSTALSQLAPVLWSAGDLLVTFDVDVPTKVNDEQRHALEALAAAFPDGVCDWSVPGVGQVPVNPWNTFENGPGGQPLGPPPVSTPI